MRCEECFYNLAQPNDAICRRCGRHVAGKPAEIVVVWVVAIVLGVFSNYILTGRLLGSENLRWLESALTLPGSIYDSPAYLVAVAASLVSLATISALAGYHYGAVWGFLVTFPAGLLSGVHLGWLLFPLVATVSGLPRLKWVPSWIWPAVGTLVAAVQYLWLAYVNASPYSPLYRKAVFYLLGCVGLAALAVTALAALISSRFRYRSSYMPLLALVAGMIPPVVFFWGYPPWQMEANAILTLYSPQTTIEGPLGEGFISGAVDAPERGIIAERQLSHVFEVIRFVDAQRASAVRAGDYYLSRWGDFPGAADVMLLKAEMHNARIDLTALKHFNRLDCYFDRVSEESVEIYTELADRFAGTPQGTLATFELAQAAFQSGRLTEAVKQYSTVERELAKLLPALFEPVAPARPLRVLDLFRNRNARHDRLMEKLYNASRTCALKIALIENNRDFGGRPIARFGALDERSEDFDLQAARLAADYKDSLIADNIQLVLTQRISDPIRRSAELERLIDAHPQSDVRDQMLLSYAKACLSGNIKGDGWRKAELALRRLLADYPKSPLSNEAGKLLEKVAAVQR